MPIAKEGIREIVLATVVLGGCALGLGWLYPPLAAPFVVVWLWVLTFFRDPNRQRAHGPGELCAPADGTVTEITNVENSDVIGGPAVRVGIFLSLFNVHINRMPCAGRVRSVVYRAGEFLDARHCESGRRNESNTLLIEPDGCMPGPVEVRQVAGLVARRIICHAKRGDHLAIGARFGLIKFGSRTELLIPRGAETQIAVELGDKVKAGLTVIARQQVAPLDAGAGAGETGGGAHTDRGKHGCEPVAAERTERDIHAGRR